jgi:acetyl-CoA carboxylase biotin carboxylase subunit
MIDVLVANRGEIALRIMRACRELGYGVVAVYSEADRNALHVRSADRAYGIGPGPAQESYLRIDRIIEVACQSGARLVHPGYGFLAENAAFAQACAEAGLTFVGPSPRAIAMMGGKTAARDVARSAGVPVVAGTDTPLAPDADDVQVQAAAASIGFPLMIKAVAGGGGKGMRAVGSPGELAEAFRRAASEAASAFGDGRCYLERRLLEPRHIEIQLLADAFGTIVPFVERECSIQRRHQKVVEESPAPRLDARIRRQMADAAVAIARAVDYTNAGTIEFLVDADDAFYFLEMNTRLQVEHPVTEAVTGIDLVQWQLRIAHGEPLEIDPVQALSPRGHAIECRIYAEDPDQGFLPSPGRVTALTAASGPGVRDDRGVEAGDTIPIFYDSLIAKLTCWAESRPAAIDRLRRALLEYRVAGVQTTLPFFRWLVETPAFRTGEFSTTWPDDLLQDRRELFAAPDNTERMQAAVAVGLTEWLSARRLSSGRSGSTATRWSDAGRRERLR